jgi:hypothetical protein
MAVSGVLLLQAISALQIQARIFKLLLSFNPPQIRRR